MLFKAGDKFTLKTTCDAVEMFDISDESPAPKKGKFKQLTVQEGIVEILFVTSTHAVVKCEGVFLMPQTWGFGYIETLIEEKKLHPFDEVAYQKRIEKEEAAYQKRAENAKIAREKRKEAKLKKEEEEKLKQQEAALVDKTFSMIDV